ncbi:signal peptide, CUB and EGF-like domain-containing protein 1 [Octopus bimaculoides]|uniref:signal peptide, CUB and EGF-like domain-containing protein 1 n=1 Tax=Octopus bimaculoides TaxID=37653 RepID=UPI0022E70AE5|nr:signal peptide, CUB and EGF-like domain-containing protein 1 [Octopus bimaculoides]
MPLGEQHPNHYATRLYFTLCTLAVIIGAFKDNKVQIDLQEGIVSGYSPDVEFLTSPKESTNDRCTSQAVIKVDLSGKYRSVSLYLEYGETPKQWTLDISDSATGNGYGGDNGTTGNMAEVHICNKQLRIYGNNLPGYMDASENGGLLMKVVDNFVKKGAKVNVNISDESVEWSRGRKHGHLKSEYLFTLNGQQPSYGSVDYNIYIAFNRVVAGAYRNGSGLCKATILLQDTPVNLCSQGLHNCSTDAICIDLRRTGRKPYKCKCKSGFYGNGIICYDVDECATENGGCVHKCENQPGNYSCSCMEGFQLSEDGHNCEDIDECKQSQRLCDQLCINTQGSYVCLCRPGYYLSPDGRTCTGELYYYNVFLKSNQNKSVNFVNELITQLCTVLFLYLFYLIVTCAKGNGGCQHRCKDAELGPECRCVSKYNLGGDKKSCIASCKVNKGGCQKQCIDTKTGPKCTCPSGYKLHTDKKSCLDIDECADGGGGCSDNCVNTHGSYECTCPKGFKTLSDLKTCTDIDECSIPSTCDHICINTPGSFHCKCRPGFENYGITHCADVNECTNNIGGCEQGCENTEGSFKCKCKEGYRLHPNQKDCMRADVCIRLKTPAKAQLLCQSVGDTNMCILRCNSNAHFTSDASRTDYTFICNKETKYEWSHNNKTYVVLPSCSDAVLPPGFKRKAVFLMMTAEKCRLKKHTTDNFKENLLQTLHKKKRYKCTKLCHVQNVSLQCGTKRRRFRQTLSKQKTYITAEFEIEVAPKAPTESCNINCTRKKTERRLKKTIKRLRRSINKEKFSVIFENIQYGVRKRSFKAARTLMTCRKGNILVNQECISCSIGTYHDVEKGICVPCSHGKYQDMEGQTECKNCPNQAEGKGVLGAKNISDCAGLCSRGYFADDGLEPCQPCPIGTYQTDIGRTKCIPCGRSIKTRGVASTSFQDCIVKTICGPGHFYDVESESCKDCPIGFYQSESSQNFCIPCPGDTTTDGGNSKNSSDCKNRKCGGYIGLLRGRLESPNYPGDYPNNVNCTWFIKPGKGRRILIIIPEIFLRAEDKCGDQLVMRKSKSAFSLQTHVTCVSTERPQAYVARSRNLWITFKTDQKNTGAGFSIPYVTYNEEYQDLMEDIVTDGQLYKPYQHQQLFKEKSKPRAEGVSLVI